MYYEEQWIEGALCWRTSPNGAWTRYTANELAHRYESAEKRAADVQATVEALQRERDGLEQNCLNNHVTIEQADAKVMKLEGERGMWATERIDLLTQLENAEFALDAEREKVAQLKIDLETWRQRLREADEAYYALGFTNDNLIEQLSQLKALVRAYGEAKVAFDDGRLREDHHAWKERFERLTGAEQALIATLDATTPAPDTSIIGKCEPPSQWDPNAQVRGDIS